MMSNVVPLCGPAVRRDDVGISGNDPLFRDTGRRLVFRHAPQRVLAGEQQGLAVRGHGQGGTKRGQRRWTVPEGRYRRPSAMPGVSDSRDPKAK
jgi:hypothetical protein